MMPAAARVVAANAAAIAAGAASCSDRSAAWIVARGAQTSKIELMRLMPRPGPACGRLLQAATAHSTLPNVVRSQLRQSRRSQPGDDAVEVEDEHVGPEDVAAGDLMRFMRDGGASEAFAELALAGEHLGLVHAVEPVERVRTGAGDQEDPLVPVAVDTLDRIVGADPGLVPGRRAVDGAAGQVQDRRRDVCPVHDQAEVAAQTRRAGVGAHRGEVAVVLGCVLQRTEATHRKPADRTT